MKNRSHDVTFVLEVRRMKIQLSHIKKSYGPHDVLIDANLLVKDKEKIALIGKNGCGKTTFLKIICGLESADSGTRTLPGDVRVGYLSQITFVDEQKTVYEELLTVFDRVKAVEKQLLEQAQKLEYDHSEKELEKYARIQQQFEMLNGYQYEVELKNVFFNFQFSEEDLHKHLNEFSSGQKTRIALVKLLLSKPDILLLDEPTNHLDLGSIEWLENYISHYPSAVILVSHDRMFLDHVVDEVIEIEFGKTLRFVGNYTHYVKAKEEYIEKNHDAFVRQQQEIERLEALIDKFRYKKNKAAFAKSKQKYLDRMDRIEDVKADTSKMKASFSCARKGGKQVLEVSDLSIGYDKELSTVSFTLLQHQRMGIIGNNGIGKSTLIKTLMEELPALSGDFKLGHQIDVGYFNQESAQMRSEKNVLDELWDEHPMANQTEIRNTLASFLFTQDEVFKAVSDLSGGERVRLALAKLMMDHDNVLFLDEPTNHLDIPSKEALENALEKYDGTILFVSHDRMFLKKMATRILAMDTESKVYDLTYEEYLEKKEQNALVESVKTKEEVKVQTSKESFQDAKVLKNRLAKLEQLLEVAEQELEELRELRFDPEYYQDFQKMEQLDEKIDDKHNEIEHLMAEWEEKMNKLES